MKIIASSMVALASVIFLPEEALAQTSLWETYHKSGFWALLVDVNPAEAEKLFRRAIAEAWKLNDPGVKLATSKLELALVLDGMGRYKDALREAEQAVELQEKADGPRGGTATWTRSGLGRVLLHRDQYTAAERSFRNVLEVRQGDTSSDEFVGYSYRDLAECYLAWGKLSQAQTCISKSLAIAEKWYGHESQTWTPTGELAHVLCISARVNLKLGHLAEAEVQAKRSLDLCEKTLPHAHRHPKVARSLATLADVCLASEKFAEAEPLLARAVAIEQLAFPNGHPDIAALLESQAALMGRTGREAEAAKLVERAREVRTRLK